VRLVNIGGWLGARQLPAWCHTPHTPHPIQGWFFTSQWVSWKWHCRRNSMRRSRTASWAEVQCPPFFVQAPSSWRTCRGLGRPLAATAVVGSPGDDRPGEAETARQRGIEAIVGPRLLVLVFSHPCRGVPGRGRHCVALREHGASCRSVGPMHGRYRCAIDLRIRRIDLQSY
jgi:hypothetical protein